MATNAAQLVEAYYNMFDRDRSSLNPYYRSWSTLSWNGEVKILNKAKIMEKLQGLPYQKVKHVVSSVTESPSKDSKDDLIVTVDGSLYVDDNLNSLTYSEIIVFEKEGDIYYMQSQSGSQIFAKYLIT